MGRWEEEEEEKEKEEEEGKWKPGLDTTASSGQTKCYREQTCQDENSMTPGQGEPPWVSPSLIEEPITFTLFPSFEWWSQTQQGCTFTLSHLAGALIQRVRQSGGIKSILEPQQNVLQSATRPGFNKEIKTPVMWARAINATGDAIFTWTLATLARAFIVIDWAIIMSSKSAGRWSCGPSPMGMFHQGRGWW